MAATNGAMRMWYGSQWVRRRYYVEEDYIKPVRGSGVDEYDPFDHYYDAGSAKAGTSLYLELVQLDENDSAAIEAFTSKHGLLGLCYHRLIQIRYQVAGVFQFAVPGSFAPFYNLPPELGAKIEVGEGQAMVLVDDRSLPGNLSYPEKSLEEYSRVYFPGLAERLVSDDEASIHSRRLASRLFSVLHSPARWDYLAEPLEQFREAVIDLRETYNACRDWWQQEESYVYYLRSRLADHIQYVHPAPVYTRTDPVAVDNQRRGRERATKLEGQWKLGWSFSSLLAAASMMLLQDFTSNRNLRFCANETCGKPFVTDRVDRLYCSATCNNQQKQRQLRRRRAGGQST